MLLLILIWRDLGLCWTSLFLGSLERNSVRENGEKKVREKICFQRNQVRENGDFECVTKLILSAWKNVILSA